MDFFLKANMDIDLDKTGGIETAIIVAIFRNSNYWFKHKYNNVSDLAQSRLDNNTIRDVDLMLENVINEYKDFAGVEHLAGKSYLKNGKIYIKLTIKTHDTDIKDRDFEL